MKTETIRFRCTKEQREKIERYASGLGLSMSAYITMILTKEQQVPPIKSEMKPF